jgi:hypothetical protein
LRVAHLGSKGRHIRVREPPCTNPLYSIKKRIYPLLIEKYLNTCLGFLAMSLSSNNSILREVGGMFGVRRELFGSVSALLVLAAVAPSCSAAETVPDCGGLGASFEFNEDNELVAAGVYPSVPPRQQGEFIHTFCAEVDNVKSYFVQQQWLPAQSPAPRRHVLPSGRTSLVPIYRYSSPTGTSFPNRSFLHGQPSGAGCCSRPQK